MQKLSHLELHKYSAQFIKLIAVSLLIFFVFIIKPAHTQSNDVNPADSVKTHKQPEVKKTPANDSASSGAFSSLSYNLFSYLLNVYFDRTEPADNKIE